MATVATSHTRAGWVPRLLLGGVGAFALVLSLAGGARAAVLMEDELRYLLESHPRIKADRETSLSAKEGIGESQAGFFPTVAATADAGPEYIDNPTERQDEQLDRVWRRTRNVAGVTVTQNLFDGFSTSASVKTAEINKDIADITLDATRQNTLFEGISAYIEVLRQRRLVRFSKENESNIRKQLELEDERVQRGSGITVDVLEAKRRLQTAKERRVSFEGALRNAVATYVQVFDKAPDIEGLTDPTPPVGQIPDSLDAAIELAETENPAVINARASVNVAEEARRTARAGYAPSVDLVGSWNYEKHKGGTLGTRRDYSVLLQASWDLFNGFETKHQVQAAAHDYGASQHNYVYSARKVIEQTKLAWQNLETARERKELVLNALNIAHEVWTSRQDLREAGKETVINVLDAENEVSNAQINLTGATYDEALAAYQLLLAMGRLGPGHLGLGSAE